MNCKNCIHWTRIEGRTQGACAHPKFVYMGDGIEKLPPDGLGYYDSEGYAADFKTGEDFGCIHYEKKRTK